MKKGFPDAAIPPFRGSRAAGTSAAPSLYDSNATAWDGNIGILCSQPRILRAFSFAPTPLSIELCLVRCPARLVPTL